MPIILAEDIGGWLAAGFFLLGGLGTAMIAFAATFAAYHGKKVLTVALIIPALIMVVLVTCWLGQAFFQRTGMHDADEIMENYVQPWLLMAFPPLATSVVAALVLIFKKRPRQNP